MEKNLICQKKLAFDNLNTKLKSFFYLSKKKIKNLQISLSIIIYFAFDTITFFVTLFQDKTLIQLFNVDCIIG